MRVWTVLKLALGAALALVGGLVAPEFFSSLSKWGEVDEGQGGHRLPIRHGARRKSRRRAT